MPRPIEEMSDAQISTEIGNHDSYRKSGKPYSTAELARYLELLEARNQTAGWRFEASLRAIQAAARRGECLSYSDLARANGLDWTPKARYGVGAHLWDLVRWADGQGLPMLSAIVVNKQHVGTGLMEPGTLSGFISAARELGRRVDDPVQFLKEEQNAIFKRYGKSENAKDGNL
jgi:hypothetical protein